MDDFWAQNKKSIIGYTAGFLALITGLGTFKTIDSGHFGVHTRFGKVLNDTIAPGLVWKIPFVDNVYEFQNNTIILETNVGTGRNTKEQNMLAANMRFHYKINPKKGVLALHIGTMSDDNGKELLEKLLDQSFDAVVGERQSSEHMANPEELLFAFAENIEWRLTQNNVPLSVEAGEFLDATIGDGTNPYRTPLQLSIRRIKENGKAGWTIERMAGPAAIPVESAGKVIKPNDKQPTYDSVKTKSDSLKLGLK